MVSSHKASGTGLPWRMEPLPAEGQAAADASPGEDWRLDISACRVVLAAARPSRPLWTLLLLLASSLFSGADPAVGPLPRPDAMVWRECKWPWARGLHLLGLQVTMLPALLPLSPASRWDFKAGIGCNNSYQ